LLQLCAPALQPVSANIAVSKIASLCTRKCLGKHLILLLHV